MKATQSAHRIAKHRRVLSMLLILSVSPAALVAVHGQTTTTGVPGFISYQGRVLDSTGTVVGANNTPVNRRVTFRIWDHPSNTAIANLIYSEEQMVTITEGEFSVLVGQGIPTSTPIGESEASKGPGPGGVSIANAFNGNARYLGVTVDDNTPAADPEITPRQQVVASAFAFRAKYAETLGTSSSTALSVLDSGNIGVGNSFPPSLFTISGANTSSSSSTPQLLLTGSGSEIGERLRIGVDTTSNGTGFIQSWNESLGAQNLLLNPNGGRVGIGTTTPSAVLDVRAAAVANKGQLALVDSSAASTSTTSQAFISGWGNNVVNDAGGTGLLWRVGSLNTTSHDVALWNQSNAGLAFGTNNSERMRIDASGNVGLGTSSMDARLIVRSNTNSGANNTAAFTAAGIDIAGARSSHIHYGFTGDIYWRSALSTGKVILQDNGGDVSIGTSTGSEKVNVNDGKVWSTSSDSLSAPGFGGTMGINDFFRIFGSGGNNDGALYIDTYDDSTEPIIFRQVTGHPNSPTTINERMRISSAGRLGIGITVPLAPLHVSGAVANLFTLRAYMDPSGAFATVQNRNDLNHSIIASDRIRAAGFDVASDKRIKSVAGISEGAADLNTLLGIQITNYQYKDKVSRGDETVKKVVAQQVEEVYPQAVKKVTDVVPDIFKPSAILDGWVSLATDLKVGERVSLITSNERSVHEVLEVRKDAFRIDAALTDQETFVYGREVKDFRVVDYDAISMLNVSATQQVKREKDLEVAALKEENTTLREHLAAQAKRLADLETRDLTREARIEAIEARLIAAAPAAQDGKQAVAVKLNAAE